MDIAAYRQDLFQSTAEQRDAPTNENIAALILPT